MIVFPGIFIDRDVLFSDVAHVSVGRTSNNVFASGFVVGDVILIVSSNILCNIL